MKRLKLTPAVPALAALALVLAGPAVAGTTHDRVVSEQPAQVAQLQATAAFPQPRVDAMAQKRGRLYAGGSFDRVLDDSGEHARSYLAAVDALSGQVTPFRVRLDGPVQSLLVHRDALYIGGRFAHVNGDHRPNLVKVSRSTGEVVQRFDFPLRGAVTDLAMVRGRLVASGHFDGHLRSFSRSTGVATSYLAPDIRGKVHKRAGDTVVNRFGVDPAHSRLVAVGNFRTVDGRLRKRAFMVDLGSTTTTLSRWYYAPLLARCLSRQPHKLPHIADVDFSPDGSYFVLGATGGLVRFEQDIGTALCDAAARFETGILAPKTPTWVNYTGGDTIWSVLATGAAVYAQGHFRWLDNPYGRDSAGEGAVARRGIGAMDPVTGLALDWNPDMPARRGGRALLADSRGLWVGSDNERLAREPHRGLGFLPLSAPPDSPS